MNISLLPKTSLGRWSLISAAAFAAVFILFIVLTEVSTGFSGPPTGFDPVALLIMQVVVVAISAGTFVTGLISITKEKERSVLIFLGVIITFWLGLVGAVGQFLI